MQRGSKSSIVACIGSCKLAFYLSLQSCNIKLVEKHEMRQFLQLTVTF